MIGIVRTRHLTICEEGLPQEGGTQHAQAHRDDEPLMLARRTAVSYVTLNGLAGNVCVVVDFVAPSLN